MDRITSIYELVSRLNKSTKQEYTAIGAQIDIPKTEFKKYANWSMKKYTRNCIHREEHYELILLCWEPGQETPIHCHGGEECWVYGVDGILENKVYDIKDEELVLIESESMAPGENTFMNDSKGYHSLCNLGTSRAMSLHLYMDPIRNCTVFNTSKGIFEQRKLSYDTILIESCK